MAANASDNPKKGCVGSQNHRTQDMKSRRFFSNDVPTMLTPHTDPLGLIANDGSVRDARVFSLISRNRCSYVVGWAGRYYEVIQQSNKQNLRQTSKHPKNETRGRGEICGSVVLTMIKVQTKTRYTKKLPSSLNLGDFVSSELLYVYTAEKSAGARVAGCKEPYGNMCRLGRATQVP